MSYKNVEMNRLAVETGMALLNAVVDVKNVLIVLGGMGFVMKLLFHL